VPWTPFPKVKVQEYRPVSNDPLVTRLPGDASLAVKTPVARIIRAPRRTNEYFFIFVNRERSEELYGLYSEAIVSDF
jgi:hypothetical protein